MNATDLALLLHLGRPPKTKPVPQMVPPRSPLLSMVLEYGGLIRQECEHRQQGRGDAAEAARRLQASYFDEIRALDRSTS